MAGIFLALVLFSFFQFSWLALFTIVVFSLLPDIDEKNSLLGRYFPVAYFFKHRGFFHSIFFLSCCLILLVIFAPQLLLYATTGFISHVLLDALTKQGVTIWPFGRIRGPFRSGGKTDFLLFLLLFSASLFLIMQRLLSF